LFQTRDVAYHGQIVAGIVAETLEAARAAERELRISYEAEPHDVRLRPDHPGLYAPDKVNPDFPTDTEKGDVTAGLASAAVMVDVTYTTPAMHNNPMEPHAAMAVWDSDGALTVYDSTQGPSADRDTIAAALGLPPERVRVVSPHVGGGFGSKGTTRPHAILAALAARAVGRPVKVALTRQQMFDVTGYRTPTIQRMRLGADPEGRLTAPGGSDHDAVAAVAAAHAVTPAQVRLAWTLQQGPHVLAIPGTGDPGHLAANVAAAVLRLSPGEMARLDSVS